MTGDRYIWQIWKDSTKESKKLKEWIAENEDMGGPKGYLDTMVSLYHDAATSQGQAANDKR